MEQHPIPQDVTGFQFKLVGNMTLKQFAYLAGGIITAYIAYKTTLLPIPVRLPLAVFFAIFGVALAFFPIEERPLDRWVASFFTSIYQPTQYIWKKNPKPPEVLANLTAIPKVQTVKKQGQPVKPAVNRKKLTQYVSTLPTHQTKSAQDLHEETFLKRIYEFFTTPAQSTQPTQKTQTSSFTTRIMPAIQPSVSGTRLDLSEKKQKPPEKKKKVQSEANGEFEQKNKNLTEKIKHLQKELGNQTITRERFLELQKELTQLLQEKENLLQELVTLRRQLDEKKQTEKVRPTEFAQDTSRSKKTVKIVPPNLAQKKGMPRLTSAPNVVTGIIKTSKGELLANILVTVKDKEEMPVRALKTNKLGQFAASAPLANGTYTIEVEDPKKTYKFDIIEIALSGNVLPPLEIFAKSEKDITRAKLHEELFGKKEI